MINKNNRGQIAIWVVVSIALVATILLIFFAFKKGVISSATDETNPQSYIERCARQATEEAVQKMLPQGGFLNPTNFKVYNDIKVSYLCQNTGNYGICINQHPMLLNEMKKEIKDEITPKIEQCFSDLATQLEKQQNNVNLELLNLDVGLAPNKIYIDIQRKMRITKGEETRNFESFDVELNNPLYDLGLVSMEIANQEAKYCYFEYVGYMLLFPKFNIEKHALSDSTKIYSITDKKTNSVMNIATRSCAIPPGI